MDEYPEHLAPEFAKTGEPSTPFNEWWARVSPSFPHVPENVGWSWLHRHWGHSPHRYIRSADYRFHLERWPAARLLTTDIRYRHDNYADSLEYRLTHARWVLGYPPDFRPWVSRYMLEHRDFPERPILLDNRDGHFVDRYLGKPMVCPPQHILIEGHNRLEYATYLAHRGDLVPEVEFWVMRQVVPSA